MSHCIFHNLTIHYHMPLIEDPLLSPTYEGWGKVMFSQTSVILSVGRGVFPSASLGQTAHIRSMVQGNVFTAGVCHSVDGKGGGLSLCLSRSGGRPHLARRQTPPLGQEADSSPQKTNGQQADGMHPTGMYTCLDKRM